MFWYFLFGVGLFLLVIACAVSDAKQALKESNLWEEEAHR